MSDNVSSVEKFRSNLIIMIDIISEMFEEDIKKREERRYKKKRI